jgi:hypothetical protein
VKKKLWALLALPIAMIAGSGPSAAFAEGESPPAISYVLVLNSADDTVKVDANVEVNFLTGESWSSPENVACASNGGNYPCLPGYNSNQPRGSNRTAIAVALQLNLYEGNYRGGAPFQASIGKNENCGDDDGIDDDCLAYAKAVQSTFPVEFDKVSREELREKMKGLERQLEDIGKDLKHGWLTEDVVRFEVQRVADQFCAIAVSIGGGCAPEQSSVTEGIDSAIR